MAKSIGISGNNLLGQLHSAVLLSWLMSVAILLSVAVAAQQNNGSQSEQTIKQVESVLPLIKIDYAATYASDVSVGTNGFALLPNLAHQLNLLQFGNTDDDLSSSGNALIKNAWVSTSVSKPMTADQGYKITDIDFHGLGAKRTALTLHSFSLPVYPFARDQLAMHSSLDMLPGNAIDSLATVSGQSTAVNGAGAIGGSINAKLKSSFQGDNLVFQTTAGYLKDGNAGEDTAVLVRFNAGRAGVLYASDQSSTSSLPLLGSEYGNSLLEQYPNFEREDYVPGSVTWNIKDPSGTALQHQFYLGDTITANGITYDGISSVLNASDDFYDVANSLNDGSYTSKGIYRFAENLNTNADIPLFQNLGADVCTIDSNLNNLRYDNTSYDCFRDLTQYNPYIFGASKDNQLLSISVPLQGNQGMNVLYMDNRERHYFQNEHQQILDSAALTSVPIHGELLTIDDEISLTGDVGYLADPACAATGYNILINGSSRAPDEAYFLQGIADPTEEQLTAATDAVAAYQAAIDADAALVCHFGLTDLLSYENATKSWQLDGTLDALDFYRIGGFEFNGGTTTATGVEYFGQTNSQARYLANFMYESSKWEFNAYQAGLDITNLYLAQNGTYGADCLAETNLDENSSIINASLCGDTFDYYFNPAFVIGKMTYDQSQINEYSKYSHKFSYDKLVKGVGGQSVGNNVFGWNIVLEDFLLLVDAGTEAAGCTPLSELNTTWLENQVCVMPWGTYSDRGTIKSGSDTRLILSPYYEMRRSNPNSEWQFAVRADIADDYSLPSIDFNYRWDQSTATRWYFNTSFGGSLPSMTQHIGGLTDTWYNADVGHRIILDTEANSQLQPETSFSQSVKYQMQMPNFFVSSEFWFTQLDDVLMAPSHIALMQAWQNYSCEGQALTQIDDNCTTLMNWVYPAGLNSALSSNDLSGSTLPGYNDIIYVRSQVINGPAVTTSGINFNAALLLTDTWRTWLTFAGQFTLLAEQEAVVLDGLEITGSSDLAGSVNSLSFANPIHDLFLNVGIDMNVKSHQLHLDFNYTTDLKDDRNNQSLAAFNTLNFKYNWRVPGENATLSFNIDNILAAYPGFTSAGAGFWSYQGLPTGTEYQFQFTYEL